MKHTRWSTNASIDHVFIFCIIYPSDHTGRRAESFCSPVFCKKIKHKNTERETLIRVFDKSYH